MCRVVVLLNLGEVRRLPMCYPGLILWMMTGNGYKVSRFFSQSLIQRIHTRWINHDMVIALVPVEREYFKIMFENLGVTSFPTYFFTKNRAELLPPFLRTIRTKDDVADIRNLNPRNVVHLLALQLEVERELNQAISALI